MSSSELSRRAFTAGTLAGVAGLAAPSLVRAAAFPQRIVSLDYGLAETLIEIGLPPVGLVSADEWDTWCVEPPLPDSVANIGANTEVNMDLLAQLKPDLIVSTPFLEGVRSQLERIAPVTSFPIHDVGGSPYPHILAATRRLGEITGRREAAEALIGRSKEIFRKARRDTASLRDQPLVFISFLDARHVRVFGPGGNFHDVLDLLELRNGWTQPTNSWGFATIGYERLPSDPGTRLFYVEPVPPDVFPQLEGSPLWQSLPFVRSGRIARMETVFMFGALPAMTRFARLLGELGRRDA